MCVSKPVLGFRRRVECLASSRIRTPARLCRSPVTMLTELSRLITTLCGRNAEHHNARPYGKYNYRWALRSAQLVKKWFWTLESYRMWHYEALSLFQRTVFYWVKLEIEKWTLEIEIEMDISKSRELLAQPNSVTSQMTFLLYSRFRASWLCVNKIQKDTTICSYLFNAKLL